jgi:hypothetical protein
LSNTPARPVSVTDPFPRSRRRQDRHDVRVAEIQEAGGEVLQATWPDGVSWHDPGTGIRGKAVQRGSTKAAAYALVTLAGTDDSTSADNLGEFTLATIVPGRYSIVVADTTFSAFTAPRDETHIVDVHRGEMTEVRVELPSAFDAITQMCSGQRLVPNTTTIAGRVLLPEGSPARGAVVRARWQADYAGQAGGSVSIQNVERSINLDNEGRFLICGVATERPIHLRLLQSSGIADTTITSYEPLLKSFEWRPVIKRP